MLLPRIIQLAFNMPDCHELSKVAKKLYVRKVSSTPYSFPIRKFAQLTIDLMTTSH